MIVDFGITFNNEKHSYRDFGLICTSLKIGIPEVKKKQIELRATDGYIDLTEVFGRPMYGNREIEAEFVIKEKNAEDWAKNISDIANYLHGRAHKFILDNDKEYYYEGRFTEAHEKEFREYSVISLKADCKPYKKELQDSAADDWLWDPFDFEKSIIREYGNIAVNGTYTMNIIGLAQPVIPVISCSEAMTVEFSGKTYNLLKGKNKIYQLVTSPGANIYKFTGNGVISIEYRGGML